MADCQDFSPLGLTFTPETSVQLTECQACDCRFPPPLVHMVDLYFQFRHELSGTLKNTNCSEQRSGPISNSRLTIRIDHLIRVLGPVPTYYGTFAGDFSFVGPDEKWRIGGHIVGVEGFDTDNGTCNDLFRAEGTMEGTGQISVELPLTVPPGSLKNCTLRTAFTGVATLPNPHLPPAPICSGGAVLPDWLEWWTSWDFNIEGVVLSDCV